MSKIFLRGYPRDLEKKLGFAIKQKTAGWSSYSFIFFLHSYAAVELFVEALSDQISSQLDRTNSIIAIKFGCSDQILA